MINHNQVFLVHDSQLDQYLSKGYYRMGMHLFTTDTLLYEDIFYNVYWLRYNLSKFNLCKKHQKILNNLHNFDIVIKQFELNQNHQELYKRYYEQVNFDAAISLESYLYSYDEFPQIQQFQFESNSIEIFFNDQLIATGIFDNGNHSIAGIINFYDPAFKKYSLGKVLVLLKLQFAIEQKKVFYYPGYIVPGNPKFDYKTFVGQECIEVYDSNSKQWIAYKSFFKQ